MENSNNKKRFLLKSYSARHKRRIVANNAILLNSNSTCSSTSDSNLDANVNNFSQTTKTLTNENSTEHFNRNDAESVNINYSVEIASDQQFNNYISSSCSSEDALSSCYLSHDSDSSYQSLIEVAHNKINEEGNNLQSDLCVWSIDNNITHSALSNLLVILKKHTSHNLPSDARTLLKTKRNTAIDIMKIGNGFYWHYGIEKCIKSIASERLLMNTHQTSQEETIELLINIDGVPLSKSSNNSLWPILCSDTLVKKVFLVGAYQGNEKICDSNLFLTKFVEEITPIIKNKFHVNNKAFNVKVHALICDAPAKAFILCTKGHSGYHSCSKCMIKGKYIIGRTCFPFDLDKNNCIQHNSLRTDIEFRNNIYSTTYQKSNSILNNIPNLGLVSNVVLDYMHLICLGVMKKLIILWKEGPLRTRISAKDIKCISDQLILLDTCTPSDFARKPRSLFDIKYWKSTELRTFLLYTGPIVLRKFLSNEIYTHFLLLHVAISILINAELVKFVHFIEYANTLLEHFVLSFQNIYGEEYVSHNVHNLIHLASDVKKYGALDEFSAFKFENHMSKLKKMIRKADKPLQQLSKRYSELENVNINNTYVSKSDELIKLKKLHTNGPLNCMFVDSFVNQYKQIITPTISLQCDNKKNCFCLLKNGTMVYIKNIVKHSTNSLIYIIGYQMKVIGPINLYTSPCDSEKLNIKIVSRTKYNSLLKCWCFCDVRAKLWRIPFKDNCYIVLPIIHTYS